MINNKEKPILFSGPMVRAILSGRKTQTRRVVKNDKPKYVVGDTLWVRETWACIEGTSDFYAYKADGSEVDQFIDKWKPSIYMPRKAARLFLKVVNVRCERLQDISETDAKAEGVAFNMPVLETDNGRTAWEMTTARTKFCSLWDSLNAKRGYGWDTNPWVWVIEFEKAA